MLQGSIFEVFLLVMQGTVTFIRPIIPHVMHQVLRVVCLSWNLLFAVCTTALRAPHVRVVTKMSLAKCVNNGRFAFCVTSDVVAARSNVDSKGKIQRNDMEKGQSLSGQHLLGKDRQYLRLGARPQLLERGCGMEDEQIVRWLDLPGRASAGPRGSRCVFIVLRRTYRDNNKPFQLRSAELAQKVRAAGSRRCCGVRTSPLALVLHLGKNLGARNNVEGISKTCK